VQQGPLQNSVAEAAVAVHHYHLLENHPGFHEYLPPSEIYEFKHQQYDSYSFQDAMNKDVVE
jgi:hypothetical protein